MNHAWPEYPFCAYTGDPRRFPDCGDGGWNAALAWLDDDLRTAVTRARNVDDPFEPESLWTWIHVFDAAIDEQDRRFGRTPRPVTRER
jgi:hypothetical protein